MRIVTYLLLYMGTLNQERKDYYLTRREQDHLMTPQEQLTKIRI